MVRIIVGGRELELTMADVVRGMRDVQPEPIREHLVEVGATMFPPKQVLAQLTGWDRLSFTTVEAIRVLTRLGFVCRRAGRRSDGQPASAHDQPENFGEQDPSSIDRRLAAVESALAVAHEAIASLGNRVNKLEAQR